MLTITGLAVAFLFLLINPITATTNDNSNSTSYKPTLLRPSTLDLHNLYRREHATNPLTWNTSLADSSLAHAKKCKFEHGSSGENLSAGYKTPYLGVKVWGDEREDYDYEEGEAKDDEVVGHFTQMVWKGSRSVGCAAEECDDVLEEGLRQWFLVCRYWPPGNVVGKQTENVMAQEEELGAGEDETQGGGEGDGGDGEEEEWDLPWPKAAGMVQGVPVEMLLGFGTAALFVVWA